MYYQISCQSRFSGVYSNFLGAQEPKGNAGSFLSRFTGVYLFCSVSDKSGALLFCLVRNKNAVAHIKNIHFFTPTQSWDNPQISSCFCVSSFCETKNTILPRPVTVEFGNLKPCNADANVMKNTKLNLPLAWSWGEFVPIVPFLIRGRFLEPWAPSAIEKDRVYNNH